jgi:ATP-dependent DNA helicase RecG
MNQADLERLLRQELMPLPDEVEWAEFKEAKTGFHFDRIGEYFSALSNEANLKGRPCGWFVFGVTDKVPRQIVGSQYRPNRADLDHLKQEVSAQTTNGSSFLEIHELPLAEGRVILFQIPPASRGVPTAWKGHYYGRHGDSIGPLTLQEIEQIRQQGVGEDWSAQVCQGASLADLDAKALAFARQQYKAKNRALSAEIDGWDDLTFLNKAKVCIAGKITHTAILLLGTEESAHFLTPAVARITWVLQDAGSGEPAYQHFDPPFILNVDAAFAKVRNVTIQSMSGQTLFPTPVSKYDAWVVREALHNCIAHQDYPQGGRINFVEEDDSLLLTNLGHFIPESVEQVIEQDAPPERYRNAFLAAAMVNLNMIDTIGSGIRRMFRKQRERSLPMPDYDLSDPQRVRVRIHGKILDERFTRILMARSDLDLTDVIALDKVQKRKEIDETAFRSLKRKGLIEGRRPKLHISATVAAVTGQETEYLHMKGFDKDDCKRKVLDYLRQFASANRKKIERLLWDKLSDALDDEQKRNFVRNLLQEMSKKDQTIRKAEGQTRGAVWVLSNPAAESGS